ncbi:archaeal heat shock protein Hsp20 [Infirmifilum sp. NZ]|uniref:archaeal heat shock protein Hsp20 n=1 Tax=Infirmifilum sp. NZ TaxID=2926850 RepID=UPI0027A3AB7F|nr:archaeal heat shock protein Hsp20 [Infirmifilum sp. NZ]UNQ72616.1 Hsp20/alpha crystallin family protein [Infirmifilum sp. NZ]
MSEFDEWFRRVRKLMDEFDKMFEEMIREPFIEGRGGSRVIGPYYYGFSVEIGPDGVPKVREWGNIRPGPVKPVIRDAIEPFTDVFDEGDYYRVIVDIPGVEKDQINIEATENSMIISTSGDRKYYKEITFKDAIKPDTAKAQYKNGVLTITVEKKVKKEREKGVKIKVE